MEEAKFRFAHESRSIWTDTDRISFTKWSWLNKEHDIQDYWEDRTIGWHDSVRLIVGTGFWFLWVLGINEGDVFDLSPNR